jgi:hypothetical protein
MTTIYHTTNLVTVECCRCGMPLGLSETWMKSAKEAGHFKKMFCCPYCKVDQGWGVSVHEAEVAKLNREKAALASDLQWVKQKRTEAVAEAEHFRKSRDGMKGALRKVKVRIGRGVCPCCNRTFENLRRHMETQHPKEVAPEIV